MEALGDLEEDFEATALDTRFKDERKFTLLCAIADGMVDIVRRAHHKTQFDSYDLAEYVGDFFTRGDLGMALAETGFQGEQALRHTARLQAYMRDRTRQLAQYSRPLQDSYRLEP